MFLIKTHFHLLMKKRRPGYSPRSGIALYAFVGCLFDVFVLTVAVMCQHRGMPVAAALSAMVHLVKIKMDPVFPPRRPGTSRSPLNKNC